ncbi:MAG: hypothetical protein LBS97_04400 [Treponema sp.]|jgi:hypothetical protein|nr:hypothetical protein [Treponema sp.]
MKKFLAVLLLAAAAGVLWAQVQAEDSIAFPAAEDLKPGAITPQFYISAQAIFSGGYNFETGAKGFRDYGGDNGTWATFSVAFMDSHYGAPKRYNTGNKADDWGAKFKFFNYTMRMDSWDTSNSQPELNPAAWLGEISGMGAHIGFFSQAGSLIYPTDRTKNNPVKILSAGNKVINLGDDSLGDLYYPEDLSSRAGSAVTSYAGTAIMYAGYENDLFTAYLSFASEGDVNTAASANADGFAGVLDFTVSPWGTLTNMRHPFTLNITGNAIGGVDFTDNPTGFGLKAELGQWLGGNFVINPVVAFDGKATVNDFYWKAGGGLIFRFSSAQYVTDEWNELTDMSNYLYRYENSKILKYAYAQVYGAYSEADDFDLVFRLEEPDNEIGFHDKLGAMLEFRMFNLTGTVTTNTLEWATWGRVSWDFDVGDAKVVTPYLRGYLDSNAALKLRVGAQANLIPYAGFEIAYTSANLNESAANALPDAGRIELIVILKSDDAKPKTPKRMDFWEYSRYTSGLPDKNR